MGGTAQHWWAGIFAAALLASAPASADTQQVLQSAAHAYASGRVLDAERQLEPAIKTAAAPADRWAAASLLIDICASAQDAQCFDRDAPALAEAAKALNQPHVSAAKIVFALAFQQYLHGNLAFFRRNGMDFSLTAADPLGDPALAVRLFLLNAAVWQDAGDYAAAHRYLDRAFASLLRIDPTQDGFDSAKLLKSLIQAALQNHDQARALRWAAIADPLIRSRLSPASFDYADYLTLTAQLMGTVHTDEAAAQAFAAASQAVQQLQIEPGLSAGLRSALAINGAAVRSLQGDGEAARALMASNPFRALRQPIIARGHFENFAEFFYATTEIFFDAAAGHAPDRRWKPLFDNPPVWALGADLNSQFKLYRDVALALLSTDPGGARALLKNAAREELATFTQGRADMQGFALPSLLDRVALNVALAGMAQKPDASDGDLVLQSLELLDRNPRYALSDTLAVLAAQKSAQERHTAHALLRLDDRQQDFETAQLRALVSRAGAGTPFAANDFSPQITAQDFAESETRLSRGIEAPVIALPKLAEVQAALSEGDAFIGYVAGLRVCVTRKTIVTARFDPDPRTFNFNIKLLSNALSAQNPPSATLDSQYPADAAIAVYHALFDGLAECMGGAHHLILAAPGNAANIPVAALLREAPPRAGAGYDLAKAHWLMFDYAVSQVTSLRDFLSAHALSHAPSAGAGFLGVGDPQLSGALKDLAEIPETATEVKSISALFGSAADTQLGADATEENFRALPLGRYQVLHFATHGLIRGDLPDLSQSALVFTPGNAKDPFNDGLLTAAEIANLNLPARLAVLSACNTANIDTAVFTSQIQGLASSFAVAGVPTTIASLWAVESGTSQRLMVALYRRLHKGDPAAAALQQAMIETFQHAPDPAFRHPRFWAPFIVLGDGGTALAKPAGDKSAITPPRGAWDILKAEQTPSGIATSEIGPAVQGRHSSVIRFDAGKSWIVEDRTIAAGSLAVGKGIIFADGTTWDGRSLPVLRALSFAGKELWRAQPASAYASATIAALQSDAGGVYAVVTPLGRAPGAIDFTVIHWGLNGKETGRREVHTPLTGAHIGSLQFAAALSGGQLTITAAYPPLLQPARNDFGFFSICAPASGTHIYRFDAANLTQQAEADSTGVRITALTQTRSGLLFAGAEASGCRWSDETAVFGRLQADLSSKPLWKDNGVLNSRLVQVAPTPDGFAAVAAVTEPVGRDKSPADPATDIFSDHPLAWDNDLSEAAVLDFDTNGALRHRLFLGNGLPERPAGFLRRDAKHAAIYGADGHRAWMQEIGEAGVDF